MFRIPPLSEIMTVARSRGADSEAPHLWRGLVAAWPLQEGGGIQAFDVGPLKCHGTLTNFNVSNCWRTGWIGRTLKFDGSDDLISIADSSRISDAIGNGEITVSAWVYSTDGSSHHIIFTQSGLSLSQGWQGYVRLDDGSNAIIGSTQLPMPAWNHFLGVRRSGTLMVYANGRRDGQTWTSSPAVSGSWQISNPPFRPLYNDVALVAVHNRALRDWEIQQLYSDPWAMYRLRAKVYPAAAAPPPGVKIPWHLHLIAS